MLFVKFELDTITSFPSTLSPVPVLLSKEQLSTMMEFGDWAYRIPHDG